MPLTLYNHGNCCGANIIDGFWSDKVYRQDYEARGTYTLAQIDEYVSQYPRHHQVLDNLKDLLSNNLNNRGQFMVILNNKQNNVFGEDLVNLFGFQLLYSDVSNPNHNRGDPHSRLWTYIYVSHPYKGQIIEGVNAERRVELGLPAEPVVGKQPDGIVIPGLPPPVPPFRIPPANLPYGVRL